jgi:hypothetical protein
MNLGKWWLRGIAFPFRSRSTILPNKRIEGETRRDPLITLAVDRGIEETASRDSAMAAGNVTEMMLVRRGDPRS